MPSETERSESPVEVPKEQENPEETGVSKRKPTDDDDDEVVGPMPTESEVPKPKKQKVLEFEETFLRSVPSAEAYEKSFMHRDVITHVVATKTDFIITASCDGHVKFWKKLHNEGIEFVKHFRCHLGKIFHVVQNCNGTLLCTISDDKSAKVFDIANFDMINMLKLGYVPSTCEWIHTPSDPISAVAIAEAEQHKIFIYDAKGDGTPLTVLDKLHSKPIILIKYNHVYDATISVDQSGMVEYFSNYKMDFQFPNNIYWEYKTDTDLYEFLKSKSTPLSLNFAPDGQHFVCLCTDRKLRIFRFATGKLVKVIDESINLYISEKQHHNLPNAEFNRRLAVEKELEKSDPWHFANAIYDESGNFIIYATPLGIKVINVKTNRVVRMIGKPESLRFLNLSLCQSVPAIGQPGNVRTAEMEASENPSLQRSEPDPMIVATAYKKNRFYLFTNTEPYDTKTLDNERDVFNEKPLKEDMLAVVDTDHASKRMTESCIIHTSLGDVTCRLFPKEAPKAVENFCTHSREGYFNGHIFHRVVKQFMIQTGDPTATGTGGKSIWGGEFEDEFHPSLKHDRPYTLSMANAGPNTNGSQFFITVQPAPWLDNKHTIFGRVTKGMETVMRINKVKTNPKNDRPFEDVSIISVTLK